MVYVDFKDLNRRTFADLVYKSFDKKNFLIKS